MNHPEGIIGIVPIPGDERFLGLAAQRARDEHYWKEMVALSKTHTIALVWRGNQHYAEFMFATEPAFDFAVASRPDLPVDDTLVLVPELSIREYLTTWLTELTQLLEEMRAAAGPGVILLGTPPPRYGLEELRRRMAGEEWYVKTANALGTDISTIALTPEPLHLKMWQVSQDMLRALAEAHGLSFCPHPADSMTPEGFLREEFWGNDATHANRAYGDLVRRDLAAALAASKQTQ
jgi:hypothetical protein